MNRLLKLVLQESANKKVIRPVELKLLGYSFHKKLRVEKHWIYELMDEFKKLASFCFLYNPRTKLGITLNKPFSDFKPIKKRARKKKATNLYY